jgi:hypothetical protein
VVGGAVTTVVGATVVVGASVDVGWTIVAMGADVVVVVTAIVDDVVVDTAVVVVSADCSSLPQPTNPTTISTETRTVRVAFMDALSHAASRSTDQGVRFCPTFNEL